MAKMKLSTISVIILVGVVLSSVGYMLGALVQSGTSGAQAAADRAKNGPGSVYATPVPVADFTLVDQKNQPFTFSSTKGKVVVMAFLFTHCGDVCPFSAIKMKLALEQLGIKAEDVELVAISTDPDRDTVPLMAEYSRDLGLYDQWHFVTGKPADMQQVYKNLKITVIKSDEEEVMETVKNAAELGISLPSKDQADSPLFGLTDQQVLEGGHVAKKYSGGYNIAHSGPFWIIDKNGNVRTSLDVSASPAQIVEAVKTYLN